MMRMWGAPIALAILTLIGVISALVGDGVGPCVGLALGVPVALCLWYGLPRRTKTIDLFALVDMISMSPNEEIAWKYASALR
jgi:hypothetical protein